MSPVPAKRASGTMNPAQIKCNKLFQQQHRLPPISVISKSNLGKMRISRMNWFSVHSPRTIDKCQLIKLPLECFFCVWNPIKLNAWAREWHRVKFPVWRWRAAADLHTIFGIVYFVVTTRAIFIGSGRLLWKHIINKFFFHRLNSKWNDLFFISLN